MKKLTRKLTCVSPFSRSWFQQQLRTNLKHWSETSEPGLQRIWHFHTYHDQDFQLQFLVRECQTGWCFQMVELDQAGHYVANWIYDSHDSQDVFRKYWFERGDDRHVIEIVEYADQSGSASEISSGPSHYVKLPNGNFLVLRYRDNAILLGVSRDGDETDSHICLVGEHDTVLYGNYSPADALYGLVFDSDVPPAYSHSRND